MNRYNANKLWCELYFNVGPLCFNLVNDNGKYSVKYKDSDETVKTYEEGLALLEKKGIKVKKEIK